MTIEFSTRDSKSRAANTCPGSLLAHLISSNIPFSSQSKAPQPHTVPEPRMLSLENVFLPPKEPHLAQHGSSLFQTRPNAQEKASLNSPQLLAIDLISLWAGLDHPSAAGRELIPGKKHTDKP